MVINETIITGKKYRQLADKANKLWKRISFWTKASDVEFDDGSTAETKHGAINGITSSLVSNSQDIAASAAAVYQLNSDLSAMNDNGAITGMDAREDGVYITYTPPGGADTVSKKLGEPTITSMNKTGSVTNGIYFDISNIEGFADLVLYKNLFPVGKTIYSHHTGATVGITISYNSTTGKLTMKGSESGCINNASLYIIQW